MSILVTFGVLCQCILTRSQSDKAGLYGIASWSADAYDVVNYTFNMTSLIKFDTNTGEGTILYNDTSSWTKNSKSCFDDKLNIWYYIVQQIFNVSNGIFDLQIILARYNLETNSKLPDIRLHEYFHYINRVDCVSNPTNGDIYLFGNNGYNNTVLLQLITSDSDNNYDVQINKIKDYGDNIFILSEFPQIGVQPIFDSKRDMVWFNAGITPSQIWYYIDITTGDIMDTRPFDTNGGQMGLARSIIYDQDIDTIIGLDYSLPYDKPNLDDGYYNLEYVDPVNLTVIEKKIHFKDYCPWFLHSPAIDYENEIFYVFLVQPFFDPDGNLCPIQLYSIAFFRMHIIGIDINNGSILTQPFMYETDLERFRAPYDVIFWNGQ